MKNRLLSKKDQKNLLSVCERNVKYKAIVLLMLDAGLRVTEVCVLKVKSIDLLNNHVSVRTLKKRKSAGESKKNRDIPFEERLRNALIDYVQSMKSCKPDDFLFPSSQSVSGHLTRRAIHKWVKLATGRRFGPHDLRHTFATRVATGTKDIRAVQDLLGHEDQRTTEIYCHRTQEQRRKAIRTIQKRTWFSRFRKKKSSSDIITIDYDSVHCHVGRRKELSQLSGLNEDKVNVILVGPQGVGKSHLLSRLQGDNILKLDDFKMVKKTLVDIAIELEKRGTSVITEDVGDKLQSVITKKSSARLVELLIGMTRKDQYTIVIDDLTDVTKSGVRVIEKLKNHFHIVAAAREIKISYASMITNFEKIDLKSLSRLDSYQLIAKLSEPLGTRIKDYFLFRDHVYEQSSGNPLFMTEVVDRLAKKRFIDVSTIREVKHTSALKDIDMSIPLVLVLSSLMVLRYLGPEIGDAGAYRLFGGVFLLFALFARPLLMATKRKFI